MIEVQRDIVHELETVSHAVIPHLTEYFTGEAKPDRQASERVRIGLQAVGQYVRAKAARGNEVSRLITIAKHAGIEGEEMRPLFDALLGRVLPEARERVSDARQAATQNQPVVASELPTNRKRSQDDAVR